MINRPHWLPDGKRLLFAGVDPKAASQAFDWYTVPVDSGEEKSCGATKWLRDIFDRAAPHSISSAGVLIYVGEADGANVYRVPFDLAQARVTGAPVPVTMAPGVSFWPSASADGTKIVFGNAPSFNTNLWALNVEPGAQVFALGTEDLDAIVFAVADEHPPVGMHPGAVRYAKLALT